MDAAGASGKAGSDDTDVVVSAFMMETSDKPSQQERNNGPQEGAELVAVSQQEVIRDTQDGTELVVASQQELRDGTQGGADLVAVSQKELNDKSHEETQLVVASQHELRNDTQAGAELVAPLQKELGDKSQEETQLVVASQHELRNDTQAGAELVAPLQKELGDKSQEGTQLVVASQQELRDDTQGGAELVAVSQKELNDKSQEGTQLMVASQQQLRDGTRGGADLVAVSQKELNDKSQEETQLVVVSQQELRDDTQGGAELVAASQKELGDKSQEGNQLVVASQQGLRDDTQGGAELVAVSQKELNDKSQEGTQLVVASQQELRDDTRGGADLVAASRKELGDKPQEGTQLVVASQQELRNDTQGGAELVAASQKELGDKSQEGTQLVLASQLEPRDEILVETLRKEVNCDAQEGAELAGASQQDLINETPEETEIVVVHRQEPNDNLHEKSDRQVSSQQELNDKFQHGTELVAAYENDLNDDYEEATEVVVAVQKDDTDHNEDGAELVTASPKEPIDASEEGTELSTASHKELNDDPQEGPELAASLKEVTNEPQEATEQLVTLRKEAIDEPQEGPDPVAVSHVAEESEEPCSTDGLAKVTSWTTDVVLSNSLPASETPVELLLRDGNYTQVPVIGGRKIKWKDMARRKPNSLACPGTEDSQAIQPAVARKSEPRRRLPESIPTQSAANIAIDAIQQTSFPNPSPSVHNNLQSQCFTSLSHGSSPSISANRQQLPYTQVSPLRFDELLQATNSVSWRPVNDCDTPFEPLGAVHRVFPPSASASVQAPPTQSGEEFSIGLATVDNAGLPKGPRCHLGTELPPVSRKPPHLPSSTHSRDFKRGHPSDCTNPLTVEENGQQAPCYRIQHPQFNQASTNHVHPHGLNLPHACRQPLPSANQEINRPSSLSVPELDPPDDTELPSTRSKRKKSNTGESPQQKRRNLHKRRLEQLRTQVIKKLKLWGRKSKLIQEDNGAGQSSNDRKRLIMGEEQRDVLVQNMVESCRKDPQMRETFLAAVKQLANTGVLHSSARLLMDQDPSGRSQDVFNAWNEMHRDSAENSSAAVNLYRAVDELHKQREVAMLKLPPVDDTSLCSLSKTSEGPWELVFPDLGPINRRTKRNEELLDERLDEPLRPYKSRT